MRKFIVATTFAALALPAVPAAAQRVTVGYTVRSTIMRAGPDFDYPAVRRVPRDARVTVYGCLRDRSWCDTDYRSDRGWIRGRDLVVSYGGRRQGIYTYPGIFMLTFVFGSYWDSHYRGRTFYNERPQWERRYYDNYQPSWGPRPPVPPAYRQPVQPSVPGTVRQPRPVRPRPQLRPQPQPQPRVTGGRGALPGVAPGRANPPAPRVKRVSPPSQSAPGAQRRDKNRDKRGPGPKQP